ncbi:hypothetical protein FALCPG4_013238 [Fusarium falciforme]
MDDARQFVLQPDAITAQQKEESIDGKEKEKTGRKQAGPATGKNKFVQPTLAANLSVPSQPFNFDLTNHRAVHGCKQGQSFFLRRRQQACSPDTWLPPFKLFKVAKTIAQPCFTASKTSQSWPNHG